MQTSRRQPKLINNTKKFSRPFRKPYCIVMETDDIFCSGVMANLIFHAYFNVSVV